MQAHFSSVFFLAGWGNFGGGMNPPPDELPDQRSPPCLFLRGRGLRLVCFWLRIVCVGYIFDAAFIEAATKAAQLAVCISVVA